MKTVKILLLTWLCLVAISTSSMAALKAGVEAPDFTLPTTTGGEETLSDYRGQVVIMHFWKSN